MYLKSDDYNNENHIIKNLKERIREKRKYNNYTQEQLAEKLGYGRTSINAWELEKSKKVPKLFQFLELCDLFDVDADYMLGVTPVESKDINIISQTLHLSETSIRKLKSNAEQGNFIDFLITSPILYEISKQLRQLAQNTILQDLINTTLSCELRERTRKAFDKYFHSIFPMDFSKEIYKTFLEKSIPYPEFNTANFIEHNFLKDGIHYIYNAYPSYESLPRNEQYNIIIKVIAEISYDYLLSAQIIELSKARINALLSDVINCYIKKEAEEIKGRIKANTFLEK